MYMYICVCIYTYIYILCIYAKKGSPELSSCRAPLMYSCCPKYIKGALQLLGSGEPFLACIIYIYRYVTTDTESRKSEVNPKNIKGAQQLLSD